MICQVFKGILASQHLNNVSLLYDKAWQIVIFFLALLLASLGIYFSTRGEAFPCILSFLWQWTKTESDGRKTQQHGMSSKYFTVHWYWRQNVWWKSKTLLYQHYNSNVIVKTKNQPNYLPETYFRQIIWILLHELHQITENTTFIIFIFWFLVCFFLCYAVKTQPQNSKQSSQHTAQLRCLKSFWQDLYGLYVKTEHSKKEWEFQIQNKHARAFHHRN